MRLTSFLNGQHFGNLAKVHNVVSYTLSPYEQRAFAGAIKNGVPNMFRRFRSNVFIISPPFIIAYMVYSWGEAEHHRLSRKNPADYVNDE